jgi:hypothetical protein
MALTGQTGSVFTLAPVKMNPVMIDMNAALLISILI